MVAARMVQSSQRCSLTSRGLFYQIAFANGFVSIGGDLGSDYPGSYRAVQTVQCVRANERLDLRDEFLGTLWRKTAASQTEISSTRECSPKPGMLHECRLAFRSGPEVGETH